MVQTSCLNELQEARRCQGRGTRRLTEKTAMAGSKLCPAPSDEKRSVR
jgi:hypothetical protein